MSGTRSVVLASQSPRRRKLLAEAGWQVTVVPHASSEAWPPRVPVEAGACELALRKARDVAGRTGPWPVLGADTVVTLEGRVYGKPESRDHAATWLRELSGRTHEVITGVALVRGVDAWTGFDRSRVTFLELADSDIEHYLDLGTYQDKAGAYGVQDGQLVADYDGPFDNIVGLPLGTVERLWQQMEAGSESLR